MIDYFQFDYSIAIAYENFPEVKKLFDAVPFSNEDVHYLPKHFADNFDKAALERILENTSIFKLTYKLEHLVPDPTILSKNSVYQKIISGTFLSEFGR